MGYAAELGWEDSTKGQESLSKKATFDGDLDDEKITSHEKE